MQVNGKFSRRCGALVVVCLLVFAEVAGCGKSVRLETVPARGKVTTAQGEPLANGTVQFDAEIDGGILTTGIIQADGTFQLTSAKDGALFEGAVPGKYRVMLIPPLDATQLRTAQVLPDPVEVAAGKNDFSFTYEQP